MKLIKLFLTLFFLTFSVLSVNAQLRQDTVNLVLFSSAGSSTHTYALKLLPSISNAINKNSVIEFKPGAEGLIAAKHLYQYNDTNNTVLLFGNALLDWSVLPANEGLNQINSFEIVSYVGYLPIYVLANGKSEYKNLLEIAEKSKTKRVSYGISRNAPIRGAVRDLMNKYGNSANIQEITYRSGSAAVVDVVNNNLDFVIAQPHQFKPMFEQGLIKYISSLNQPIKEFPTQSLKDQGMTNIDLKHFPHYFIWANKGADKNSLQQIRKSVNEFVINGNLSEFISDKSLMEDPSKTMLMLFK